MGALTNVGPGTTIRNAPGANPVLEDCHQMIFDLVLNAADYEARANATEPPERKSLELSNRLYDLADTCEAYIVKKDDCFERSRTSGAVEICKMPGTYQDLNQQFKEQFDLFKRAERDYLRVHPERPVARLWIASMTAAIFRVASFVPTASPAKPARPLT
jgi:hypothetical protein